MTHNFDRPFFHFICWQDLAGLVCAVAYSILAWLSLQPEFLSLWEFYALLAIALVATLTVCRFSTVSALTPLRILFWAGCFRLIGIFGDPLWEDDFFRYLWDGYRFFESGSPYGVAPSEFFGDSTLPEKFQWLLARVNYPQVPTIYGPTVEYTFLLSHMLAPAQVWPLQLLYSAIDMALILVLIRMAKPRWVLLYAWSPLVIKELAFTAHPDGVGVTLLVLAIYCRYHRLFLVSAVALALSVGAKVFALILVPFVLWRMPVRYWGLFVVAIAVLYAPFVWQGASDLSGLWVFATEWQFNSSFYELLLLWLSPVTTKLILGCCYLGVYFWLFFSHVRSPDWQMPRGDILFGVFFLVAPVVNAWYLIWLLPFAVLFPRLWSWSFSVVVLLSYTIGINMNTDSVDPFHIPLWVTCLEYGIVFIALCGDIWMKYSTQKKIDIDQKKPDSISC